jgi:hypothetical protein
MTGIYVFTWTASVSGGNWETKELVVDGTPYGYSMVDSDSNSDYANVIITYRLPIKAYYRICTFRHIRTK